MARLLASWPAPDPSAAVDVWLWLEHAGARLVYRSQWVDPTGATVINITTPRRAA